MTPPASPNREIDSLRNEILRLTHENENLRQSRDRIRAAHDARVREFNNLLEKYFNVCPAGTIYTVGYMSADDEYVIDMITTDSDRAHRCCTGHNDTAIDWYNEEADDVYTVRRWQLENAEYVYRTEENTCSH